MDAMYKNIM